MSVIVYRDTDYQGPFARIRPGFYTGQDLRGFRNKSVYGSGEDLNNAISSIRVEGNTIVALYGSHAPSASSGSRVIVGPTEVPDLSAFGINDKVSSIQVISFREYNSGIPRTGGAILYSGYTGQGGQTLLERGDYNSARLSSEEIKFPDKQIRSVRVSENVIAILYAGPNFDTTLDAVVVVGPTMVDSLDSIGIIDRVSSVKVMYTDPYDTPGRPKTTLGSSRTYFPGGGMGFSQISAVRAPKYRIGGAISRAEVPQIPNAVRAPKYRMGGAISSAPAQYYTPSSKEFSDTSSGSQMWIIIFIICVLVLVIGAYITGLMRTRSTKKTESSGPPGETTTTTPR